MTTSTVNIANNIGKIFVDANIILEIILRRDHFNEAVNFIKNNAGSLYISPLTVHLVMYFGLQVSSVSALRALLSDYFILPLNSTDVLWAFDNLQKNDFEDAMQLACAVSSECDSFITFDKSLIKHYEKQTPIKFIAL